MKRVNSRETSMAEQCACKSNNDSESRCSTHGDDIEPVGESRADVETGYEEEEELKRI